MNLTQRFELTNAALKNMTSWPLVTLQFNGDVKKYLDKESFQMNLNQFRNEILHSNGSTITSTITDVLSWYTSVNAAMLDHLTNQIKETDNSGVWRYLLAYKNLLKSIESTGISSVYGVGYFSRGTLNTQNYISYIRYDAIAKDLLNTSLNYVPKMKVQYKELTHTMKNYGNIRHRNEIIKLNKNISSNYTEAVEYFHSIATYTDELRKLQRDLRYTIT